MRSEGSAVGRKAVFVAARHRGIYYSEHMPEDFATCQVSLWSVTVATEIISALPVLRDPFSGRKVLSTRIAPLFPAVHGLRKWSDALLSNTSCHKRRTLFFFVNQTAFPRPVASWHLWQSIRQ